ncbi:MAG: pyridoxamine 5'-phosphate oxidase family protein [Planctomycetes bacterium]|nr:pyridoxamine 5'-phosphate oxidase family protein [Planctomycetota bacterium]
MAKLFSSIDDKLAEWITAQHLFFVATAPSGDDGHVNCSPRSASSLRVLDGNSVAWLDGVGSGIETVAHLRQNGRIVLMFCAFDGPPRIVRLHGRGTALEAGDPEFAALRPRFGEQPFAERAIVRVAVSRIGDSCGFGVPLYRYEGERDQMGKWADKKGRDGAIAYMREKNGASVDGLPGLCWPGDRGRS